jgi:RNA polymerase sigma-70 factor (ECF subfamily)
MPGTVGATAAVVAGCDRHVLPGRRSAGAAMTLFATTHWSVLIDTRSDGDRARSALETLCRAYRRPVLVYLRRKGHAPHDAEDLVQAFFSYLIEQRAFASADRERGRFRNFLLGSLKHFLSHQHAAAGAQKRGGGVRHESLDDDPELDRLLPSGESPERSFDRVWALTVLDRALQRLQAEAEQSGKRELFSALREYVVEAAERSDYAQAAGVLGMRPNTVAVVVHRLRARLRELVEAELRQTVANESALAEEMGALRDALGGR